MTDFKIIPCLAHLLQGNSIHNYTIKEQKITQEMWKHLKRLMTLLSIIWLNVFPHATSMMFYIIRLKMEGSITDAYFLCMLLQPIA